MTARRTTPKLQERWGYTPEEIQRFLAVLTPFIESIPACLAGRTEVKMMPIEFALDDHHTITINSVNACFDLYYKLTGHKYPGTELAKNLYGHCKPLAHDPYPLGVTLTETQLGYFIGGRP